MVTLDFSIKKHDPHQYSISRDDLRYLDEKILHSRSALSATSYPASICGSRVMEAARTSLVIGMLLLNDVIFSYTGIAVDEMTRTAECRYDIDSYISHMPTVHRVYCADDQCVINVKYTDACPETSLEGTYTISICSKLHKKTYEKIFTLNSQQLMTYDMNFPAPSDLVEWVITCVNAIHQLI